VAPSATSRHSGIDRIDVFLEHNLEVAAGIRQPLARRVARHGGLRLLEHGFMEIRQAVATLKHRSNASTTFLREAIEDLKANGFVEAALNSSGQDAAVSPSS